MTAPIRTEALVIGAGPVGLFQVFELGLLGIGAQVVDALPRAGGQLAELYPTKPIYDIPGTPVCTATELVDRLLQQIRPFAAAFHFDEQVESLVARPDGRFEVGGSRGTRWVAGAIVVASGAGAFQPRRLKLTGLERFEGRQLHYQVPPEPLPGGERCVVIGDEDPALAFAIGLAAGEGTAGAVTLMHRRDEFRASPERVAALRQLRDAGRLEFVAARTVGVVEAEGRLTGLVVATADGAERTLPLDRLVVLTGLSPKLGPIADWGLALERKQLVVDPATFATTVAGIHAVGDAVSYPGKKRLIVCGFHEATLAAYAIAERLHPDRPQPLEYTTTSPRLHRRLGLVDDAATSSASRREAAHSRHNEDLR